jgi:hypothetical protein
LRFERYLYAHHMPFTSPRQPQLALAAVQVEAAFQATKSPLMDRPIFHHLEDCTQTHIIVCNVGMDSSRPQTMTMKVLAPQGSFLSV